MSKRSNNLTLLTPKPTIDRDIPRWATVTSTNPVRITLDGESSVLPFTPDMLVSDLGVGDRVRVEFATNGDPSTLSRRCIITGKAGSMPRLVMNIAHDPGATAFHSTPGRLGFRNTRWFGSGGAGTYAITSVTDPKGGTSLAARKTWTTAPSGNGDTGFELSYGWSATDTQGYTGLRGGYTYTVACWMRGIHSGGAGKVCNMRVQWHDSGGVVTTTSNGANFPLTNGVWVRPYLTFVVPGSARYATFIADNGAGGTAWANTETLDATWLMLSAGRTLWEYMDGGQPGGIWLGTANASYSQGYTIAQ